MIYFWLSVVAMTGVALLVVLRPLFGRSVQFNIDANAAKVDIYRNRLQEMEAEVANGVLSGKDADAARTELARALVQETDSVSSSATDNAGAVAHWRLAAAIAVLVPIVAVSLYLWLGTPALIKGIPSAHGGGAGDTGHAASIEAMVEGLAQRLEQNPDDAEGWMMLVNSYLALGKHESALKAVERLYQITGDEPVVLVRYADVLATVNGGDLSGKPSELIQKALSLDPENVIGLWLAGMAAAQGGNDSGAIDYWQRVLPLLSGDQASQAEVSTLIAQARGRMGDRTESRVPEASVADTVNDTLEIKVSLSPQFSENARPEQSLFIVAKAINGPPMPVAVIRRTVADLPLEIKMDDSNAMVPSTKLSSFPLLELSARVSPGGNAIPQSGDPVSATAVVSPGQGEPVVLVIDRKVP